MKNKKSRKSGFTLVEIMIVVAIIGLLAAIAIPNFIKNRTISQQNACINNLRMIDAGKEQWAMETGQSSGATVVTSEVNSYIKGNATPKCPTGKTTVNYTYGNLSVNPVCTVSGHAMP